MTGNQTDLAARLRQAIGDSAFGYGDDDPGDAAAESTAAPIEAAPPIESDTETVEDVEEIEEPAEEVDEEPAAATQVTDEADEGDTGAWHALVTWRLLPVALVVITVLLAGLGAVMLVRAHADQTGGPMANQALVSAGDTQAVVSQVSTALNQMLSYDMANPKAAQQAARHWLVGDATGQYQTLVTALGKVAAGQQLTMVAKVSTAAVLSMHDGTAQLLVFLDQESTRASDHSSSVAAAQVQITAKQTSGGWRISEIVPL